MTHGKIELGDVLNFFEYQAVAGEFEAGHSDEEKGKLAAVHFVRFRFPAAAVRAFADAPAFLAVDHPAARARVELSAETKAALSEDLLG
jgi:hypothetical protein